jgi:energy-coupling factor transporter transmembrane protein EcfT
MIGWGLLIIIAILFFFGFVFIKLKGINSKFWLVFIILLLLFLFGTGSVILSRENVNLNEKDGLLNAVKLYLGLLGNGFQNLKSIGGEVIKMNWTDTNGSFFNKSDIEPVKK